MSAHDFETMAYDNRRAIRLLKNHVEVLNEKLEYLRDAHVHTNDAVAETLESLEMIALALSGGDEAEIQWN